MGAFEIKLEGLDEAIKEFERVSRAFGKEDKDIEAVLLEGAKMIRDEAKARAPVLTGALRKGIVAKKFRRKIPGRPAAFVGINFRTAPHANLVEFGTVRAAPHPFFFPAVEARKEAVLAFIKGESEKLITDSIKK